MDITASDIMDTLAFLQREYGLDLSIHFAPESVSRFPCLQDLLPCNCHRNPYCMQVKKEYCRRCLECQKKVLHKCRTLPDLVGECHAGVLEYVQRIQAYNRVIGFISVSGYRGSGPILPDSSIYDRELKSEPVPEELLKHLMPMLSRMLELYLMCNQSTGDDQFRKILSFIEEYHTQISLEAICEEFHFSKSYISHLFKSKTGYTLKGYCNRLKMNDARHLLRTSGLSVTEIAYLSGFEDLSYFVSVFKKQEGCTPLAYRKNILNSERTAEKE